MLDVFGNFIKKIHLVLRLLANSRRCNLAADFAEDRDLTLEFGADVIIGSTQLTKLLLV